MSGCALPTRPALLNRELKQDGEYIARENHQQALRVGVATWLGITIGLIAKVVIAFVMIGIFVAALLI